MKFESNKSGGGGPKGDQYIKLKDEDTVQGVFAGEPYQFNQHWRPGSSPQLCDGGECCAGGEKASFRFRINLLTKVNGKVEARVFEQGWTVWKMLEALNKKVDLERYAVDISRSGSGKDDTTYTIFPLPDGKIDDAAAAKLKEIPLIVLEHNVFETEKDVTNDEPPAFDDDGKEPVFHGEDDLGF